MLCQHGASAAGRRPPTAGRLQPPIRLYPQEIDHGLARELPEGHFYLVGIFMSKLHPGKHALWENETFFFSNFDLLDECRWPCRTCIHAKWVLSCWVLGHFIYEYNNAIISCMRQRLDHSPRGLIEDRKTLCSKYN